MCRIQILDDHVHIKRPGNFSGIQKINEQLENEKLGTSSNANLAFVIYLTPDRDNQ